MRRYLSLAIIFVLTTLYISCAGGKPYHKDSLPDPSAYRAHFPDIDTNGDELVNLTEFKQYFPKGDASIFKALDLNRDNAIDHDEWHEFKGAHGH